MRTKKHTCEQPHQGNYSGENVAKIFFCLVAIDEKRLLKHEDLRIASKLANAHYLLKPLLTYPKNLANLYKQIPCHFDLAVELQNFR